MPIPKPIPKPKPHLNLEPDPNPNPSHNLAKGYIIRDYPAEGLGAVSPFIFQGRRAVSPYSITCPAVSQTVP